jgi:FtsH-binding integral membrane protein
MEELGVWARLLIVVVLLVVVQLLVEVHVLLLVLSVLLVLLVLLCMAVAVTNVKRARKRPLVGRVVGIGHLFFILHLLHHTPKDTCTSTRFASSSDSDRDL